MCGIAGVCFSDPDRIVSKELLSRMCGAIAHRGPDDQGIAIQGNVGLGMRRLSIIDLNTGQQPIYNEDRSVAVVYNGEIYNFLELRRELQGRGHKFTTTSDTEVIVHLYEDFGDRCVERLRGMFVFALWDSRSQRLLIARDRLGVKPLYYYHDQGRLIFGSEIKSILQDSSVPRSPNLLAIDQILTRGYSIPPDTCFEGISELPHASTLVYHDGRLTTNKYWDLKFTPAETYRDDEAIETFREQLQESIQLRMISDVPIGALLSGGLDSSIVVAMMSGLAEAPIKTFSVGFGDRQFSELGLARLVADRFNTEHHEFIVEPHVADLLPTLVRHYDSPIFDSSAVPTYYVCKMASQHVKVVLSGDGGDELLAGYNLYKANRAATYYQMIPSWIRRHVVAPLSELVPESSGPVNKGRVLREFVRGASLGTTERYLRWTSKLKGETRDRLYRHAALLAAGQVTNGRISELFDRTDGATELGRLLYVDINSTLVNDMLTKVDRMSMAVSLEVRSPLLDYKLFEFAATLPDRAKLRGWKSKYLLRSIASHILPAELLEQPKRGFSVPLNRWIQVDLADYARDLLLDSTTRSRGLFDVAMVERMLTDHINARKSYAQEIWTMLTIEQWYRDYIDRFER